MNITIILLVVVAGFIAVLLIVSLLSKKEHYVRREIVIGAPRQKVFDYVKLLKNQDTFNTGAMADADRKKEFSGTDGTVGYIYSWSGNKSAGQGEKEIMNIVEGNRIEMEIRFVKPMAAVGHIIMETESLSDNQTKVSWSNSGTLRPPLNIMIPLMEKAVAKDMDISLSNLKTILEK